MSSVAGAQQGPVEARSLSSITAIASNPPAYPRNPTHEKLDPLQLYIVRVPGSQDIFLSPLKPPTKSSISAEAINASLYYLHVATPEDDALLQEVEHEREEEAQRRREAMEGDPAQREFARMNHVRRKPVGGVDHPVQDAVAATATTAPAAENLAPSVLPRGPVPMPHVSAENMSFAGTPAAIANADLDQVVEPIKTPTRPTVSTGIQGRPLPPLPPDEEPLHAQPISDDQPRKSHRWSAFVDNFQGLQERGLEAWKEKYETMSTGRHSLDSTRPRLPPRPVQGRTGSPNRKSGQSPTRQKNMHHSPQNNTRFHITLIRRDPASGTQWNVATISIPRMNHNTVDIEISTPGYNRFIGSNEPLSLADIAANLPAGMRRPGAPSLPPSLGHVQSNEPQVSESRKFHRQLCVSRNFEDPTRSDRGPPEFGNGQIPEGSKLKSGYYVFNSPWNGTCTFSTSVNGRSLKCKHLISGPGGIVPSSDNDGNPAVTVAEIRFNTPFQAANLHFHASNRQNQHPHHNPSLASSPNKTSFPRHIQDPTNVETSKRNSLSQFLNPNTYARPRAHSGPNMSSDAPNNTSNIVRRNSHRLARFSRQNQFAHQHTDARRSTSTSSGGPDSDEDRLDFSLARELAGGGMRGKSAKLGKLVIEDEGIKMLDLVVAACMAVWWRGYYH
ncbi:hypothetical protein N7462_007920 [Penicillium macrosclerotiorum]|uniref:uncharacterized protein n=1 Tax=Penicillium macrosclerotiorum TaxID=303699 RepID=UPI0025490FBF|nr:uncharacterized protein N7462_007920 [Penicillium macrosclerotiorum]KAJ5679676.1 hypothetical protein N7462_007920 [Penicillium macrosclerotiorum]